MNVENLQQLLFLVLTGTTIRCVVSLIALFTIYTIVPTMYVKIFVTMFFDAGGSTCLRNIR